MAGLIPSSMPPQPFDDTNSYPAEVPSYEDATNPKRRMPSTSPDLTPYLGLQARLSQVWFNRWTLLLILVLVRLMLATRSLDSDMDSARKEALSACTSVESMGSAMASMPTYMAAGVNEIAAKGIETGVQALGKTLLLMVTAVQEIVVFIINLVKSTYVCLITLAIQGSLGAVLDASEKIADYINGTLDKIFDNVSGDIDKFESNLKKVTDTLNKIPGFFDNKNLIPTLSLPSLDGLKNINIPSEFDATLQDIRDHIPTFDDVRKAADDAITIPFQAITVCLPPHVRKLISMLTIIIETRQRVHERLQIRSLHFPRPPKGEVDILLRQPVDQQLL